MQESTARNQENLIRIQRYEKKIWFFKTKNSGVQVQKINNCVQIQKCSMLYDRKNSREYDRVQHKLKIGITSGK